MPGKETEWATPPPTMEAASRRAQAGCPPKNPGRMSRSRPHFQLRHLLARDAFLWLRGQISTDKAGTLSDLEARICCFSAQSSPSKAQLDGAPSTWRTEEPPTAGGTAVPPKHSLSLPHNVPRSNSARQSQHGPTLQKRTLGMGSQRGLHGRHSR